MKGIFPTWPTLSGPQSHLVTANLTSLFSLYWEGLNLMHLPSFQEEEGSGRSGHHESLAKSPSGALLSFCEIQADLFCQGWGPICFPALPTPFMEDEETVPFLLQLDQGKGKGIFSQDHPLCSYAPLCPI